MKVAEGENDEEFIITKHTQFEPPINVINIYGQQECRSSKEDIKRRWQSVLNEVYKIESQGELLVIAGDMNKHLKVESNKNSKTSFGGRLIEEFIETGDYVLINTTKVVTNGPNTRYSPEDPNDENKKSMLTLVIVSKQLLGHVDELYIDNDLKFTPFRVINKNKRVYTDHYAVKLTFKELPIKRKEKRKGKKYLQWNTNKDNGWSKYHELTSNNAKLETLNLFANNPELVMNKMEKELKKIKFHAFGKVKTNASIVRK